MPGERGGFPLARRYHAEHVESHNRESTAKEFRRLVTVYILPSLGKRRVADAWVWWPDNSNPCRLVKRYPERARARFYSEAELSELGKAVAALEQGCELMGLRKGQRMDLRKQTKGTAQSHQIVFKEKNSVCALTLAAVWCCVGSGGGFLVLSLVLRKQTRWI